MTRQAKTLHAGGAYFEGPRWHDNRWWVSDMWRGEVISLAADGSDVRRELTVPSRPSGLGWTPDGTFLVVSMLDKKLLRRRLDGVVEVAADLAGMATGRMCNDMVVDAAGRAWIGYAGGDAPKPNALLRVDPDGAAEVVAEKLLHPNGVVVGPDGRTLIVSETFGTCLTAFTISDSGALLGRRTWADLPGVGPDGICVDAVGRVWVADAFNHRCLLVEEGGTIFEELPTPPGLRAFACMLGGPDGRTLLQCCAPEYNLAEPADGTTGTLLVTEVDVPRHESALP